MPSLAQGIGVEKAGIPRRSLSALANSGKLFIWNDAGAEYLVSDGAAEFTDTTGQSLSLGDDVDFEIGNNKAYIAIWYYLPDKIDDYIFIAKEDNFNGQGEIRLIYHDGLDEFRFVVSDDGSTKSGGTGLASPSTNTWYFVEFVHDPVANEVKMAATPEGNASLNSFGLATSISGGIYQSTSNFLIGNNDVDTRPAKGRTDTFLFVKGYIASSSERDFLFNGGAGRTPVAIKDNYEGTNGGDNIYDQASDILAFDEVSGNRVGIKGKVASENGTVGLAQGIAAGQPYDDDQVITQWEDRSGNNRNWEQGTSSDKPFTTTRNGELIAQFDGSSDHFNSTAPASDWEGELSTEHFVCIPMIKTNAGVRGDILSILDTGATGGTSQYEIFFDAFDKFKFRYQSNGSVYEIESNNAQVNSFDVFSVLVKDNGSGNVTAELWKADSQLASTVVTDQGAPLSGFDTSLTFTHGSRNNDGTRDNFFDGESAEPIIGKDLSDFDEVRKELVKEWI